MGSMDPHMLADVFGRKKCAELEGGGKERVVRKETREQEQKQELAQACMIQKEHLFSTKRKREKGGWE